MKWPRPSQISARTLRVWQRNYVVYRQTWKISFVPPLLEPLLYILAFGMGLAVMVGDLQHRLSYPLTYQRRRHPLHQDPPVIHDHQPVA